MLNSTIVRTFIPVRSKVVGGLALALAFVIASCSQRGTPVSPTASESAAHLSHEDVTESTPNYNGGARGEELHRWVVQRQRRAPALHEAVFLRGAARKRGRYQLRDRRRRRGPSPPGRDPKDLRHRGSRVPTRAVDTGVPSREPMPQSSSHDRRVTGGRTRKRPGLAAQPHRG
jgi:hypothetical protein